MKVAFVGATRGMGRALARRIESGAVCVNDCLVNYLTLDAPMGGRKDSGIGRRHGSEGIRKFCHQQTVVVDRFGLKSEIFWYPLTAGKRRLFSRALNLLFHCRPMPYAPMPVH